jgi:hypothetical protein
MLNQMREGPAGGREGPAAGGTQPGGWMDMEGGELYVGGWGTLCEPAE